MPALPAQLCARRPRPSRRRHAAPPPSGARPPPVLACFSSLVTAVTPRRAHLPPIFAARQTTPCVHPHSYPPMPACKRDHTHTHTHSLTHSRPLVLGLSPTEIPNPDRRQDGQRRGPQRPLPQAPLPCCSPRPRRAGSTPRCAQVAFLKGKLHQPPEAQCRRESTRPAAPLAAPPELVVFWFRRGGGQEFGESLESGEGLRDLAKSLPSLNSSPGRSPHPPIPGFIPTPLADFSGSSSQGIKLQVSPAFR